MDKVMLLFKKHSHIRLFFFFGQKFGHWYWHPELPRRTSSEFTTERGRGLRVDGLLVRRNCWPKLQW